MGQLGDGAAAPRKRFVFTIVCFALANVLAWAVYAHWMQPRRDLLRVERFEPGDDAVVLPRQAVTWRFNLDVAPAPGGNPPGKVTPAVAGRWEWPDTRTLLFVPDTDLAPATQYRFELSPQALRTADDFRLAKAVSHSVMTTPLRVEQVRQAGMPEQRRFVLEFVFNDKVLPADLKSALRLRHLGKDLGFDLHGEAAGPVLRVITDALPEWTGHGQPPPVEVELHKGLAGASGPLGLREPYTTSIVLEAGLACTGATAYAESRGQTSIYLNFNGEISPEALRQVLSIEPAVPFTLGDRYSGSRLQGDFQPATRYVIKLGSPPPGEDRTRFPRPGTVSVFVPDRPASVWFEHAEGYLGAEGNRTLLAHAVNVRQLEARVWRVYDNNLVAWRNAAGTYKHGPRDAQSYGKPVATKRIELAGTRNTIEDIRLELDDLLPANEPRDGVYRVGLKPVQQEQADDADEERYHGYGYDSAISTVTLSDIGLTAKLHGQNVTVWAVSLKQAKPLPGVRVRLYSDKNQLLGTAVTEANGLANIEGSRPAEGETPAVIVADRAQVEDESRGGLTWLHLRRDGWDTSDLDIAGRAFHRGGLEAFVYVDRGVYRPGETVHLRAIVRDRHGKAPKPFPLRWQIRRPDQRNWRGAIAMPDADGSLGLTLQLPHDLATGRWSAHLGLPGENETMGKAVGSTTFLIEEFLPDRMKVAVKLEEPAKASGAASPPVRVARVQAAYLFGQPAAGLSAELRATLEPSEFEPAAPQWRGWVFGDAGHVIDRKSKAPAKPDWVDQAHPVTLDEKGAAAWQLDLTALAESRGPTTRPGDADTFRGPWRMAVSAGVREAGGRAVTGWGETRVDVLPWYIGLRSQGGLVRPGEPATVDLALVRPDGTPSSEAVELQSTVFRVEWNTTLLRKDARYEWDSKRVLTTIDDSSGTVITKDGKARLAPTLRAGGEYLLRVRDPRTGAMGSIGFYVGDGSWEGTTNRDKPERLEIIILDPAPALDPRFHPILSRLSAVLQPAMTTTTAAPSSGVAHRVGTKPRALIRSPFAGTLLLSVETDTVVESRVIEMPASQVIVPVEVTGACRPNAYISATVVRDVQPELKWRTHRAFGITRLNVDPSDRKLALSVDAPDELRPTSPLEVTVTARDAAGNAVPNASLTLAAVDEGILQLTRFATPDPLGFFHSARALGVRAWDVYGMLMPEVPKRSDVGGDVDSEAADDRHHTPISARRVISVAKFSGVVRTDGAGRARVHFDIPPAFAGRLRVMAVGHAADRFGSAQRDVVVRSPLIVQSSLPRFAAPGDQFEATLAVFNNTTDDGELSVLAELEPTGPLAFAVADPQGQAHEVPLDRMKVMPILVKAGGKQDVRLKLTARHQVGVGRVKLTATLGAERWEETVELPVRPASPTITRGGYLAAGPGAPVRLDVAGGMLAGTASLEVRVTPWPSLQLPEGLDYLDRYPYGCAEQTISGCFPLVYLSELGPKIAPGIFEKQRVAEKLRYGIDRLIGMQTGDGGIAMWAGHRQAWSWTSVYAAHLVVEAEKAGHDMPAAFRDSLLSHLRSRLETSGDSGDTLEMQAYATYVLALAGKPQRAAMNRLAELAGATGAAALPEAAHQRAQAKLFLALAWMAAGREDLAASILPPPRALPRPRESRQTGGNIGSPIRDRAMLVRALVEVRPDDPELPSLVQQLADAGKAGQWRSTQDCSFALMAIGSYLRHQAHRPGEAYDAAELRLGEQVLAAATQRGAELFWRGTAPQVEQALAVHVRGAEARGHVSWLETGVPMQPPPAVDNGMRVRRIYTDRDGKPVTGDRVTSGQLVRVELWVEAPRGTENLVLEDLLPAGLEIENPRLETTAARQEGGDWARLGSGSAAPFQATKIDIRDDRLIVVGPMPQADRARYVYLARAVTPGTYVVPPVRGECMYDIAMNSLHGAGRMTIDPVRPSAVARVEKE